MSNTDKPTQGPGLDDAANAFAALMDAPERDTPQEEPEEEVDAEAQDDAEALDAEDDAEGDEDLDNDEDDDEGDDEADANDEEDDDESDDEPELYTVKIDGKEEKVSLEEALKGYQRQADYTRKTQALSEKEKTLQTEMEQVRAEREQYAELLPQLEAQIEAAIEAEPDWKALEREDPYEYLRQKEAWRDMQAKRDIVAKERKRMEEQKREEAEQQFAEFAKQEREKLLKALPEWKDKAKLKAETAKLREYGLKLGFTEDQLAGIIDHRLVLMIRKAMKYDDMVTTKPKRGQRGGPRPTKAGAGVNSPTATKRVSQQKKRLQETGSLRDAASLFERIL